jgi:hypothetical protein
MLYLNAENNKVTWNKKNYLLEAAKRLGIKVKDAHGVVNPECVLNIQPFGTFLPGCKWTGIWHIDVCLDSHIPDQYYYLANDVFVASNQMIKKYDKAKVLFQACDPILDRRIPEIKQEYDFVACGLMGGAYNGERERLFNILAEKFKTANLGSGLAPHKYVEVLNRGKIQWVRTANASKEMAAQRFFESLAIGPVLTNWTDDLPLTGLIEDEDYMAYRNDQECIEKMELLLNDEELRNKIATNGRIKALTYHTYDHRLMSILNICREYETPTN